MDTSQKQDTPGYYSVTISSIDERKLLSSNNDRAFIVSQLQDLLSGRSILESPAPHRHLASHIDLLAFSIQGRDIRLIAFAISPASLYELSRSITDRLRQYQDEYSAVFTKSQNPVSMLYRLTGPHHALTATINVHLRHNDWEYDRYSSIGFYLHDRRGDWMRPWRLTKLFQNEADKYRLLVESSIALGQTASHTQQEQRSLGSAVLKRNLELGITGETFDSLSHE